MRLLKRLWVPCALLLLGAGALLLMADVQTYGQEGAAMTVVEDSVTSRSVTVEILNTTDRLLSNAGEGDYRLQRRLWGLWLPMREKEPEMCGAALPVRYYEPGIPQRFTIYWCDSRPFDALYPGQYRLILDFWGEDAGTAFALAAEFTVK